MGPLGEGPWDPWPMGMDPHERSWAPVGPLGSHGHPYCPISPMGLKGRTWLGPMAPMSPKGTHGPMGPMGSKRPLKPEAPLGEPWAPWGPMADSTKFSNVPTQLQSGPWLGNDRFDLKYYTRAPRCGPVSSTARKPEKWDSGIGR